MTVLFEQIGAELSFIKAEALKCDWNQNLHYCRTEIISNGEPYSPTSEDDLLHDVLIKVLFRGYRPFVSYFTEQCIVDLYGGCFDLREKEQTWTGSGSITYTHNGKFRENYAAFTDIVSPWKGDPDDVSLDPEHPENERKLLKQLIERFGPKIAHCITPQAELSTILPANKAAFFLNNMIPRNTG